MTYSVYNLATKQYDYYQVDEQAATHVTQPPAALLGTSQLGCTPEQFAWKLPSGAVKVGAGEFAQGKVASTGDSSGIPRWMVYVAVGYLVWRWL